MRRIGYKSRVTVTNDALVALVAGAGHAPGVVIVSGTGSIAFGRNAKDEAARSGGWGYILGDEGSGYWIGRHALRAVMREADGRGPATVITPRLLRHFDVTRAQDLVHPIYHTDLRPSALARLAHYVQEAHDRQDHVAAGILEQGARELMACAGSVVAQLDLSAAECVFVLAGGMFHAVPWLAHVLRERIPQIASRADVRVLDKEPAWGAVLLALADLKGEARVPVYKT
jgi:N-acetylglucosamine kinase-like BadF-type ATPase